MQSESRSRRDGDARAHEARQERTRAEAREGAWARVWAPAEAKAQEVTTPARAEAEAQDVGAPAEAEAEAEAEAAEAEAQQSGLAPALALVRVLVLAPAEIDECLERAMIMLASALLNERPSLPSEAIVGPTYAEVLADLKIKAIIDSIEPYYRHRFARDLWHHPEHFWWIQMMVPVTRLPRELLQSILSIIIGDASGSPLRLMLVCKQWYTALTGIWGSLKLGTRTPRDTVTRRLEWNQSPLDIFVDMGVDRGDFTPSEGAYEGIFATIEATSRWRSFVVETFPGQADLPDHLVNRGLQQCSNPTMSRLETFKVTVCCVFLAPQPVRGLPQWR